MPLLCALAGGQKPGGAGDGDIGAWREERLSSKATWESDCSETSALRRDAESNAGGSKAPRLVEIQPQPDGRYLNWLKYAAAAYVREAMVPRICHKRAALASQRSKLPAS